MTTATARGDGRLRVPRESDSELRGSYVYGDLCDNHVRTLRLEEGRIVEERDAGFGEDVERELYVLSLPDGLFKLEPT